MHSTAALPFLTDALVESLMTMAFLDALPATTLPAPTDPLVVRVAFAGSRRGALEIVTTAALGTALVVNMLGIDPKDPAAAAGGHDALKELE